MKWGIALVLDNDSSFCESSIRIIQSYGADEASRGANTLGSGTMKKRTGEATHVYAEADKRHPVPGETH